MGLSGPYSPIVIVSKLSLAWDRMFKRKLALTFSYGLCLFAISKRFRLIKEAV